MAKIKERFELWASSRLQLQTGQQHENEALEAGFDDGENSH
jgi:hypothetical protein